MHGLMSGDWKRSTVSGPQRLQPDAWTAPDLSATAPALDSTPGFAERLTDLETKPTIAKCTIDPIAQPLRQGA